MAVGDVDLGRGDDVDVVLAHGAGVVLGKRLAQCLFAGDGDADARLEHLARRLAGTEAGDADLAGDATEGVVDRLLELGLVDLDGNLDQVLVGRRFAVVGVGVFGYGHGGECRLHGGRVYWGRPDRHAPDARRPGGSRLRRRSVTR